MRGWSFEVLQELGWKGCNSRLGWRSAEFGVWDLETVLGIWNTLIKEEPILRKFFHWVGACS
jgi:hypothetical protein